MNIVVNQQRKTKAKSQKLTEGDLFPARQAFAALAPYIDPICWGINKRHTIAKAEFVAFDKWCEQRNRGVEKPKVPILDEDGDQWLKYDGTPLFFNYFLNYKRKLWKPEAIVPCIDGEELHYFMSPARAGKKLIYLDLDDHDEWQDDLSDAIALLKELFGEKPFYRFSHGGYNGWLKIGNAPSANEFNAGLARMEKVLKDVYAQSKIKTSVEIKGRSVWGRIRTFDDRRSHLAKLPYWNHFYPCNKRDEDDCWNARRLREFEDKPDINWKSLMAGIDQLEAKLDPVRVEEGKRYLDSLKNKGTIIVSEQEPAPKPETKEQKVTPLSPTLRVTSAPLGRSTNGDFGLTHGAPRTLDQIRQITDAFVRNREFALYAARLARRPLTADELLEQDRRHHIHNGEWEDGLAERKRRYRQIAPFVARTFDESKCGNAESQRPTLDENLRSWKAKSHLFPKIGIGYVGKRGTKIDRQVLIGLTAIIQTVSKPNRDCPRDSIQGWWEELAAEDKLPAWNVDLYTAARSVLARYKIIRIDHIRYQYVPDAKGQCKGIWIREQKTVGERNYRYPSSFSYSPSSIVSLHKGYDGDICNEKGWSSQIAEERPPP